MRSSCKRLTTIARLAVTTLAALAIVTPASAQLGGLKKRAKEKAGQEASRG